MSLATFSVQCAITNVGGEITVKASKRKMKNLLALAVVIPFGGKHGEKALGH